MKNKKLWSILLFVVPLAIGIPLAIFFIPTSKTKTEIPSHFNYTSHHKDSIEIKLDILIKKLNQIELIMKKNEITKSAKKDTIGQLTISSSQKQQTRSVKTIKEKQDIQNKLPSKQK